jgi:hypothetical protein
MRKSIWIILAVLLAAIGGPAAHADTNTLWTLNDITFSDGATLTGEFIYDSTTDILNSATIFAFTDGPTTVLFLLNDYSTSSTGNTQILDASGGAELALGFVSPLNTSPIPSSISINPETTFVTFTPIGTDAGLTGNIVSSSAPEPGTLELMLIGLGVLLLMVILSRFRRGVRQII